MMNSEIPVVSAGSNGPLRHVGDGSLRSDPLAVLLDDDSGGGVGVGGVFLDDLAGVDQRCLIGGAAATIGDLVAGGRDYRDCVSH